MDIAGPQEFDLLVIGGGATGAGIARDAAGRGLAVCLAERGDLAADLSIAADTCAWASEGHELSEHERLHAAAPHLIEPPFHGRAERVRWLSTWRARRHGAPGPTIDTMRLIVLTALDAAEHGAQIRTHTDCIGVTRRRTNWTARLKGPQGVHDITAWQVAMTGADAAAAQNSTALRVDRGWDGRAPALLHAAEAPPRLARAVAERALALLGVPGLPWTAAAPLPGGDIPGRDFDAFLAQQARFFPWLPTDTLRRMAHAYGTRLPRVLGTARSLADCGQHFGGGLYAAEVIYLIRHEFARSAGDVLRRGSAVAQCLTSAECEQLMQWFARFRIDDQAISAAIQLASER